MKYHDMKEYAMLCNVFVLIQVNITDITSNDFTTMLNIPTFIHQIQTGICVLKQSVHLTVGKRGLIWPKKIYTLFPVIGF